MSSARTPANDGEFGDGLQRQSDLRDAEQYLANRSVAQPQLLAGGVESLGIAYRYVNGNARVHLVFDIMTGPPDSQYVRVGATYERAEHDGNVRNCACCTGSDLVTHVGSTLNYDMECAVLVPDIESVQYGESPADGVQLLVVTVPSVVRLEILNGVLFGGVDATDLVETAPASLVEEVGLPGENGEFGALRRIPSARSGEFVGEVVQCGPEIEKAVADDESRISGGVLGNVDLPYVFKTVVVRLHRDWVNVVLNEDLRFRVGIVHVSDSATELPRGAIEGEGHDDTIERDEWSW
jgi:hypothetical protein